MKIKNGVVIVAVYSRSRNSRGQRLTIDEAKKAFLDGSDCLLTRCDGHDGETYCSIRDFAAGSRVRVSEGTESTVFVLQEADMKPHLPIDGFVPRVCGDIPTFMTGLPVELD
jgi:hypothetical protein